MSYSSKIDLTNLIRRDYNQVFLTRNPFPSTAIPDDLPQITVDREDSTRHFRDVISALYVDGSSSVSVLVGGYGSGKSHLLKVFKNNINSQLLESEEATLGIYINSPGRNFLEFFFSMIDDIGRDVMRKMSNTLIKTFLLDNEHSVKKLFIRGTINDSSDLSKIKISKLFDMITTYPFLNDFIVHYIGQIKNTDLLSALFFLSHPTYSDHAWRWFLGERISVEERKFMRISGIIDHHRIAYNMIEPLINVFKNSNVINIVFLIDELEKILLITSTLRSQYQDDFRHLIDDNPRNLAIFFSITPGEWDRLSEQPSAFTRRLSGNRYVLDDFDIERIIELIKGYLHYSRIDNYTINSLNGIEFSNDYELFPFTYESIENIMKITNGRISSIILVCRRALDLYIDNLADYEFIDSLLIEKINKMVNF